MTSVPPAREILDRLDPRITDWVEAQWGTEVADADRLAGGVTSTVLRLTGVDDDRAVLRLMTEEPWRRHAEGLLAREADIQRFLEATDVPALGHSLSTRAASPPVYPPTSCPSFRAR
ncbi:MAG: hypothetical protein ACRDPQ_00790 [Nocardioidaceae bacterium]